MTVNRREFAFWLMAAARGGVRRELERNEPRQAPTLDLSRRWINGVCHFKLKNRSSAPVVPREVVLFDWRHTLPAGTRLYAEGFQMLSQTAGTLAAPAKLGGYEDAVHYRIPKPADATTVYNLLLLSPDEAHHVLLAFTSSRRFVGRFHLRPGSIQVACDLEGLALEPGEAWDLEDFTVLEGARRAPLLEQLAQMLRTNHPIELPAVPPRGWCSWVAFADNVNGEGVLANARAARERIPALRYMQIDGGYMDRLGDWMEPSRTFGGSVRDTVLRVRDLGLEPGLWLAPFIAERASRLFAAHASWFMSDASGAPLPADRVTFGGWSKPPWFALDGTHPEVQEFLEGLLHTLRHDWATTYFKLDANFWGAMHGGRLHDPRATRVEAYRRGMAAIRRGAGDAFLLGCNHPMWPSLGVIHGSRSSNDIEAKWDRVRSTSRENLSRLWQNGRVWWNDPDTVQFAGSLTAEELGFHLAVIHASGGILMCSDNLPKLTSAQVETIQKLAAPTGGMAVFDADFQEGRVTHDGRERRYLLNWSDAPATRTVPAARDFWSGTPVAEGPLNLGPHAGRILELVRSKGVSK